MRWLGVVLLAALLGACANDAYAPESTGQPDGNVSGEAITVFAASSLTGAFEEIGQKFEEQTGAGVSFSFGGSADLRAQLEQGAPADVFATADGLQMSLAADEGVVEGDAKIFARNRLVVIVPKANSAGIVSLEDLARDDVKVVLADEAVPIGHYSRDFLDKADVEFGAGYQDAVLANVVTEASSVKEVVSAVQLDEVDAGIVYATDVTGEIAGDVTTIEIPDELNVIATYPIARTADAGAKEAADAFIAFVLGDTGQGILAAHGFMKAGE
jgi:molybdate transport system substrate-binding protein